MITTQEKYQKLVGNLGVAIALCLLVLLASRIAPAAIEVQNYDWKSSSELYPGIRYAHTELSIPRKMVVNCLQIDAHTPGVKFYTTPRCEKWIEGKAETTRQTTRNFIRQSRRRHLKLVVAINANAFSPWPAPYQKEEPTDVSGFAVSQGVLVSNRNTMPSLLVNKMGRLQIDTLSADADISNVETAVSGFGLCLVNGEASASGEDLHPRTGLGLSKDGRYLLLMTIDGRQPSTPGATIQDVGNLLKMFGAHTGINMDGGGSTTMAWWDPTVEGQDKCRLLNQPIGNGDNYQTEEALPPFTPTERANGNNLGVYFLEANITRPGK